jgi:MATE family multidrug resistance protein
VAAFVLFAGMLARLGETELAAHVLVLRVISLSFLPGHAIGEASSVLVGQAVGGRRPDLARQAWSRGTLLALGVMTTLASIFALIPELVVAPFGPSPEVVELSIHLLWVGAAFQVFDAVAMVGLSTLNGAGDTRFAMWCSVLPSWLVKLPVGAGLALSAELGAVGAWLGLTAEIVVVSGLVVLRIRGDRWLRLAR